MEKQSSVYRRGAENGLIMGPLMGLALILMGASSYIPLIAIPAMVAFIAVPTLLYILLRRSYELDNGRSSFSALWLQGICAFFFGGLLMGVIIFVSLRWLWPGYVTDQINTLVEILEQSPDPNAQLWIKTIDTMRDSGNMPTPIQIVLELIYLVVFTGSLLSMLLSMVVRARRRPTPPPFNP